MCAMRVALEPFRVGYERTQAYEVAATLSPTATRENPARLYDFYRASNAHQVEYDIRTAIRACNLRGMKNEEVGEWTDIFVCYWKAVGEILRADEATNQGRLTDRQALAVYEAWKDLLNQIVKHVTNGVIPAWSVVIMYTAANQLRRFAMKADEQIAKFKGNVTFSAGFSDDIVSTTSRNVKLEECARIFNRIYASCLGDRNSNMAESRKWGAYYMANLQFRTYFKLKNISLSKNIVKSIEAQSDLPDFQLFPAAHRVTYKYYVGVLAFLQEDYSKAEACLTEAWDWCRNDALKNQELILTYLIPCRLISKHSIPSQPLLDSFPRLNVMFGPLVTCIKHGDLSGFDKALVAAEDELVRRRIYLTLERGRDIALRNLLRKVFLAQGYEDLKEGQTQADRIRKTRIPLPHFAAAFRLGAGGEGGGQVLEEEEVECMLANMIYKGLMKGYISRDHNMVVLNKKGAFPGTGV